MVRIENLKNRERTGKEQGTLQQAATKKNNERTTKNIRITGK